MVLALVNGIEELKSILGSDCVLENEPMKNHTSFKVGGPADILVTPNKEEDIIQAVSVLKKYNIPYVVMGNGSNLIVKDRGIRGAVIKISDKMSEVTIKDDIVISQAGILLSRLANCILEKELTGFEFASGIPGTLGGAVYMNAGAYDGCMSDIISETKYLDCESGQINVLSGIEHKFAYRSSIFQDMNNTVILSVKMKLKHGNAIDIRNRMKELTKRRKEKQPLEYPSAGSTFKRPPENYAARLIEECGLKGMTRGGAMVSEKHAGFIINIGNATADDILSLIDEIKNVVYAKTGILLCEEVKILGE